MDRRLLPGIFRAVDPDFLARFERTAMAILAECQQPVPPLTPEDECPPDPHDPTPPTTT